MITVLKAGWCIPIITDKVFQYGYGQRICIKGLPAETYRGSFVYITT